MAETQAAKEYHNETSKTFAAFLCFHKAACGTEARLVKEKLKSMLGVRTFLGE